MSATALMRMWAGSSCHSRYSSSFMTAMLAYWRMTLSMRQFVTRAGVRFNRKAVTQPAVKPCIFVIPSDVVAAATEESRDPYSREQSPTCCCDHIVEACRYRGPSTPRPPDPQRRRVGNSCGRSAQDDSSRFMEGAAESLPSDCHPILSTDYD